MPISFLHPFSMESTINPLYTGRLSHCYMLDKTICHFRGVMFIMSLILFLMENPVRKL